MRELDFHVGRLLAPFFLLSSSYEGRFMIDRRTVLKGITALAVVRATSARGEVVPNEDGVTPQKFGAVTNSAVDNTDAFKRMRDYVDSTGAAIRLPPGRFLLRDQIVFASGVQLFGAGPGRTQLGWDDSAKAVGFISSLTTDESDMFTVRDLSFVRAGAIASGTALQIDGSARIASGYIQPRSNHNGTLSNVDFRGDTETTGSFVTCLDLKSVLAVQMSQISTRGSFDRSAATPAQGLHDTVGIKIHGDGHPVEVGCFDHHAYFHDAAFDIDNVEGVVIQGPTLVTNNYGVKWAGSKPQLTVQGGHINSVYYGIHAPDLLEGSIQGVLFYNANVALPGARRQAIFLGGGAALNVISGNVFDTQYMDCIVLGDVAKLNQIGPNVFHRGKTAITLGASTTSNVVSNGQIYNGVSTRVIDEGSGNQVPNGGVLATLNAPQAIATARNTAIAWGAADQSNPNHWTNRNPTRLTVQRTGIYALNASLLFAANATGVRRLIVLVNGTELGIGDDSVVQAMAGVVTSVNFVSRKLTLAAGDYVEIHAYQDSGSSLAVTPGSYAELRFETQA